MADKPITEIPAWDFMIVDQRLWDLCRHQRGELRTAGLITDEEYAAFALNHAAVARLEDYGSLRAQVAELSRLNAQMVEKIAEWLDNGLGKDGAEPEESVEHRGCCNRLILEANNESLRAENGRLNAQIQDELIERKQMVEKIVALRAENGRLNAALVQISAIRHAVSGAAEAANYALEIADKALAEKPAPEVSHD